jgi:hypothetical protein
LHTYQLIYGYIKQANVIQQYRIWLCWKWNDTEDKYEDKNWSQICGPKVIFNVLISGHKS